MKLGQTTKDGLVVIQVAKKVPMVMAFTVGMEKPAMIPKSKVGSKIPKQVK